MVTYLRSRITIWVILGGLGIAGLLVGVVGMLVYFAPMPVKQVQAGVLPVTVIPGPTFTPLPSPTALDAATETPAAVNGIAVGMFVQITGTGGDGLHLRSGAGTNNAPRFLGYEAEVFRVKDGPKFADGFTWWFLEAPYDSNRSGWAAANYLAVVAPPQ